MIWDFLEAEATLFMKSFPLEAREMVTFNIYTVFIKFSYQ